MKLGRGGMLSICQVWECPHCPRPHPASQITLQRAWWGPKSLGATGRGKGPSREGRGAVFSVPTAVSALLLGPHFLPPASLLQTSHHLQGSRFNLSCPLTPTRNFEAEGGHGAKDSLELMKAHLCRCQCKIEYQNRPQPPIRAWGAQLPPSPLLGRNQGPHPQKRKGKI